MTVLDAITTLLNLDKRGGNEMSGNDGIEQLVSLCDDNNLTDVIRHLHPDNREYIHFLPSGSFLRNTVFVNRQMYFPFNIILIIIICQILE